MADNDEEARQDELQALFTARTNAKRRHTNLARRVNAMFQNGASRAGLNDILASLDQAYTSLINVHERFVTASRLDGEDLHTAQVYLENVRALHTACLGQVERAQRAGAAGGWNVSVNVNAINRSAPLETPESNEQQNPPTTPNRTVAFNIENEVHANNDTTGRRNLESDFEALPQIDQVASAKRRKLDLELLLHQKKVQIEREQMDLETRNRREQEDILFQIQQEEQLLACLKPANDHFCSTPTGMPQNNLFAGVSPVNPPFSSSTHLAPNTVSEFISPLSRAQPITPPSSAYANSHRWPKLTVAKFDGDPRGWTKYARNINATLGETSMPESLKLLALQESLLEVIQRRMAHVFTGSRTFQSAWAEIESKYGNPGLIIQAHNQHLQQLAPFKTGDFSGLFDMATAVRDAVSSVSPDNCIMFTSVIGSLPAKMPMHLQTDWGKLAYGLKRMPTIIDFDRWIDTVVGAEELRGAKLSLNSNQAVKTPAANYTRNNSNQSAGSSNYNNRGPTILAGSLLPNTAIECPACHEKAGHRLESCNTFTRMLVNARAALCATNNHCFKCLFRGHYASKCRKPYNGCSECGGPHHLLLHGADRQFPAASSKQGNNLNVLLVHAPRNSIGPVLLAIVQVIVEAGNRSRTVFAVLDPGSEATLITRSLADRLNLKGYPTTIRFGSFASSTLLDTSVVSFRLRSAEGENFFAPDEAFVVPNINLSHRKINWPKVKYAWPHLASLQLPAIDSTKAELLIGMDLPSAHQTRRVITPFDNGDGPSAHETCFGYAVVGKIPRSLVSGPSLKVDVHLGSTEVEPSLAATVERFQSNQSFGVVIKSKSKKSQEEEDRQMLDVIKRSIKFVGCGYEIELPIRPEVSVVPNNRSQALSRFFGVERRLAEPAMRDVATKYEKIMENLISSGTAVAVCRSDLCEPQNKIWYLPHFFVVNPNKPQKIRVVLDAKARFCATSYNSIMLRGPPSIPSLVGVLLRARQFRVALSADITAFYHRIGVAKQHQSLQRFVYRKFGSKEPLLTYQFTTLIFGAVFSSSAAVYALQHAANECTAFPQVASKMPDNFYADNLIDSFETEEEAMEFSEAVRKSLEAGGFSLTAFASSSQRVLENIPMQQRSANVLDLNVDALPVEYHLGIELDLSTDSYSVRVKSMPQVSTRREMLAAMSLTFDPLGICLPVITGAKLLFQLTNKLEKSARGWDQPLPADLLAKWNVWADGLAKLSFPRVSRCFRPADLPFPRSLSRLVVFADASSVAFGAVAYLRTQFNNKVHVSFVMAKGRSASLRPTTIPRMELQAAVLAVRLSVLIKKELRIPIASVEYYTDSQIVLWQLRSDDHGRPSFVRARREEILSHSVLDDWHFVRSSDNPADECTRGVTPKDFGPGCRWITGPSFLMDPSYVAAPFDLHAAQPPEKEDDVAPIISIGHVDVTPCYHHPKSATISKLITNATELSLLKREVVKVVRHDPDSQMEPTVGELAEALRVCLLVSQSEVFVRECKALLGGTQIPRDSVLRRVGPYIDPDSGLMKVDGRLEHAELPARTRHPIIIAPDHPLTRLIIEDCHQRVQHSGVEHTLSVLREQYYLPQGRRAIRRTLRKCVKCKRLHSLPQAPKMANLPKERLQAFLRVFTNAGLDCFGPFQVVIGRRSVKRYGLLLTCLSSRAVHLEVLDSMDADSFIMALRRFISLRGSPAVIYSDNGTNLKAGDKELAEGIKNLNSIRVKTRNKGSRRKTQKGKK